MSFDNPADWGVRARGMWWRMMLAVLCARGRAEEVHREEQELGDSGSGGGSARAYLPRLGPQWSGRNEVRGHEAIRRP